jgi:hypothetical protein
MRHQLNAMEHVDCPTVVELPEEVALILSVASERIHYRDWLQSTTTVCTVDTSTAFPD